MESNENIEYSIQQNAESDNMQAKNDRDMQLTPGVTMQIESSPPKSPPLTVYQIKWVKWHGKDIPIITQNENGPCPLLALVNALLLMEKLSLPTVIEIITPDQLIEYIADYILNNKPKDIPEEHLINYEQNVQDALSLLPKLQTGLDVNIRFTGPKDFEYTPECIIFDLLNIPLCHGWIVDPLSESQTASALGNATYNQIIDKIITDKFSDNPELVSTALVAETFLKNTSHQLTYHGLCELNAVIKPGEMVVLFRNNHFCTLTKFNDNLYTLVTDQGYLSERLIMWETLTSVEGNETFVNGLFQPIDSTNQNTNNYTNTNTKINVSTTNTIETSPQKQKSFEGNKAISSPGKLTDEAFPNIQDVTKTKQIGESINKELRELNSEKANVDSLTGPENVDKTPITPKVSPNKMVSEPTYELVESSQSVSEPQYIGERSIDKISNDDDKGHQNLTPEKTSDKKDKVSPIKQQIDADYLIALTLENEEKNYELLESQQQEKNLTPSKHNGSPTGGGLKVSNQSNLTTSNITKTHTELSPFMEYQKPVTPLEFVPNELLTDSDLAKKLQAEEDFKLAQAISAAEQNEQPQTQENITKTSPNRKTPTKGPQQIMNENIGAQNNLPHTQEPGGNQVPINDESTIRDNMKKKCTIS